MTSERDEGAANGAQTEGQAAPAIPMIGAVPDLPIAETRIDMPRLSGLGDQRIGHGIERLG